MGQEQSWAPPSVLRVPLLPRQDTVPSTGEAARWGGPCEGLGAYGSPLWHAGGEVLMFNL